MGKHLRIALVLAIAAMGPIYALQSSLVPATPDVTAAVEEIQSTLGGVASNPTATVDTIRSEGLDVAIISSGIDTSMFPEEVRSQIRNVTDTVDHFGLGNYAASVVFSIAPNAHITSWNVYAGGKLNPAALMKALRWASDRDNIEAVIYAVPTGDYLDPVSTAMVKGLWNQMIHALPVNPMSELRKTVLFPVSQDALARASKKMSAAQAKLFEKFASEIEQWNAIKAQIRALRSRGVAIIDGLASQFESLIDGKYFDFDANADGNVELPSMPAMPALPGLPAVPGVPAVPGLPAIPTAPSVPGLPGLPGVPAVPGLPAIPGLPAVPGVPSLGVPTIPSLPGADMLPLDITGSLNNLLSSISHSSRSSRGG
ncbi:MAG: hypothetical protein ACRDKS_17765, partial [Actinomycetota bacterium]